MCQPAHDHFVFTNHLLAVNPQVLAIFMGSPGHYQGPSDQRAGIIGPASLYGPLAQVDLPAFEHTFLARGVFNRFRRHV